MLEIGNPEGRLAIRQDCRSSLQWASSNSQISLLISIAVLAERITSEPLRTSQNLLQIPAGHWHVKWHATDWPMREEIRADQGVAAEGGRGSR